MRMLKRTKSVCPKCKRVLEADIVEENEKVFIIKTCPEHGTFKEVYWSDYYMYFQAEKYGNDGRGVENPKINASSEDSCPWACGLCNFHKSHTVLANIFVTNRCDLRCWYCFANAGAQGYVYEPDFETIVKMLKVLRENKPVPTPAVQFTGGEPLLRDDMLDIVREAKKLGFPHIQLNTNGLRFAREPELAVQFREAGVNVVYLSFDGVTEKTNPKNHKYIPAILDALRDAEMPVVLVPTVIKGVNDHEIGAIIDFAIKNIDIVRGVNFQPVSFVGSMPAKLREKMRITIPDVIHAIEEQTSGKIPINAFYPVPTVVPVSRFVEALTGEPQVEFTAHPHCGMATYLFVDEERNVVPITDFIDVPGFITLLNSMARENLQSRLGKAKALAKLVTGITKVIDTSKAPSGMDVKKILIDIFKNADYSTLGEFHWNALFIGMMHFQDPYNYDIERVKRCVIHYATPDGRIIPFCTYNVFPEVYRDKINKQYGMSIEEWERKTGRKLEDEIVGQVTEEGFKEKEFN